MVRLRSSASKAGKASLTMPERILARVDPELDETHGGNVEAGTTIADINI